LYLHGKDLVWYKRNKDKFVNWVELKKMFLEKYEGKEVEILAWNKLQRIKQVDFSDFDDFEAALDGLFQKAKVKDKSIKFRFLVSALTAKHQKLIFKRKVETFDDAIELIVEEEKLNRFIDSSPTTLERATDEKDVNKRIVKVHKSADGQADMYEALITKFNELSLNILSKLEQQEKSTRLTKYDQPQRDTWDTYRKGVCYHCKEVGHRKYECPKLKDENTADGSKNVVSNLAGQGVGCLELESVENKDDPLFAVEKRGREVEDEVNHNRDKILKHQHESRGEPMEVSIPGKQNAKIRPRRKMEIRLAENMSKYSIKNDLERISPSISMAQLLQLSPEV
ncbi:hypothetical protein BB559_006275, partial [Furculomyces boomerangus]